VAVTLKHTLIISYLFGRFIGGTEEMKVILIHNPEAGGDDQPTGEELVRLIRNAGHSVLYQTSNHADWQRALEEPADLVAMAGGDGLVGLVAKRLVGKRVSVTILPMGTANNVASALNLKGRPLNQLIAGWTSPRRVKFDVAVAKGPWGSTCLIEGLGAGAFTDTMSRLDARKNVDLAHHDDTDKKIISALQIMKIRLESCSALRLNLAIDGRDLSGDYVLLEAMNIRSVGPNLCLAPHADPADGLLDFVLVRDDEREQLNQYLSARIEGNQSSPELTVERGRRLHIECDETRVHIDDDVWPRHGEHPPYSPMIIDVSLHPESLEMVVPSR
jgi:diacylglycerol kinase family enzyme